MNEENKINLNRFPHDSYQYFPMFEGSTGGWLRSAESEEKYVITWTSPSDNYFEMPIGGSAKLNIGLNLFYFSRKEQCLALGKQLRSEFKINDYKIFRLIPGGEIQFLHPKDSVFPEKVNQGRVPVGKRDFSIGLNPNPSTIKFSGKTTYDTESLDSVKFLSENYAQFAFRYKKILKKFFIEESIVLNKIESNLSKKSDIPESEMIDQYVSNTFLGKKIELGDYFSDFLYNKEIAPYLKSFEIFFFSSYFDNVRELFCLLEKEEPFFLSNLDYSEVLPQNTISFINKIVEKIVLSSENEVKLYFPRYYKNLIIRNSYTNSFNYSSSLERIPFSKIWTFSQYVFCFSSRLSVSLYNMDLKDPKTFSSVFFKKLLIIFLYCQHYEEVYGKDIKLIKLKKM